MLPTAYTRPIVPWQAILAFAAAYLLGSIDFGVLIPRLAGVDIYSVGSGNPGASNVARTMGRGWAAAVLAGDAAKGLAAVAFADLWVGGAAGYAAMLAAVAGHCYPVWHRFRGGKGVATAGGALLWLHPMVSIGAALVWVAIAWLTRIASIGSLVIMVGLVPAAAVTGARGLELLWLAGTVALVVYRHRGNIERLVRGEERKVRS